MLAIYKYTLIKYVRSPSTWVILFFASVILGFVLGSIVPFRAVDFSIPEKAISTYVTTCIATVAGIVVFMTIFASVFAGFKGATMYKDEVENGTFLVILSKPLRRSTIILGKWLSLQTMLLIYSFVSVFTFCVGVAIFDPGKSLTGLSEVGIKTLSSQIASVGGFAFIIVYVASLIFSSLALLISTRLPVSTTVGILIALGVVIPITSVLSVFLRKPSVDGINNVQFQTNLQLLNDNFDTVNNTIKQIGPLAEGVADQVHPTIRQEVNDLRAALDATKLYHLGVKTGETDTYAKAWIIDLNYQFSTLAEYAYEKAIPFANRSQILGTASQRVGVVSTPSLSILSEVPITEVVDTVNKHYDKFVPVAEAYAQLNVLRVLLSLDGVLPLPNGVPATGKPAFTNSSEENIELETENFIASVIRPFRQYTASVVNPSSEVKALSQSLAKFGDGGNLAQQTKVSYNLVRALFNYLFDLPTSAELAAAQTGNFKPFVDRLNRIDFKPILDYRLDIGEASAATTEAGLKHQLLRGVAAMQGALETAVKNATPRTYNTLFAQAPFISAVNLLLRPVGATLLNSTFQAFYSTTIVNRDDYINRDLAQWQETLKKDFPNLAIIQAASADATLIRNLLESAKVQQLVTYETKPYVNKSSLLIGYILVALILVPITYPIIRRQDFR